MQIIKIAPFYVANLALYYNQLFIEGGVGAMKKTIRNVFLIIGVLVLCLLIWAVFFNNSLEAAWNSVRQPINNAWNAIVGGGDDVIQDWDGANEGLNGGANVDNQINNTQQV